MTNRGDAMEGGKGEEGRQGYKVVNDVQNLANEIKDPSLLVMLGKYIST